MQNLKAKIAQLKVRKHKGFSLAEILVSCAIIIALSGASFFMYSQAQHTRRMAQMHQDMENIAMACTTYESLAITGALPATVSTASDLDLEAVDSIDGVAHKDMLHSSKTGTDPMKNPWNGDYTITPATRCIATTPNDIAGSAMATVYRYF